MPQNNADKELSQNITESKNEFKPKRLSIDETRGILLTDMQEIVNILPLYKEAIKQGVETLKNKGIAEFKEKHLQEIKDLTARLKKSVEEIKLLPATFGLVEPESQEKLDKFCVEVANEFNADRIIVLGHSNSFWYSYGFNEEGLKDIFKNIGDIATNFYGREGDSERMSKGKEALEKNNISSIVEVGPDLHYFNIEEDYKDYYARVIIARSEELASKEGEFTDEDIKNLKAKVTSYALEGEIAPWGVINHNFAESGYDDFGKFMTFLRHNGGVDVLSMGVIPYVERFLTTLEQPQTKDDIDTEIFDKTVGDFEYLSKPGGGLDNRRNEAETWLDVLKVGTDFKVRNITDYATERIGKYKESAKDKGLDYIVEVTDENLFVESCDLNLLGSIIDNLIGNAIKYTPKGRVTIRVSKKPVDYNYRVYKQRLSVVIEVEDTGIGIPNGEERDALYKEAYRASNVGDIPGTGIGLASAVRYAENMRGQIDIESEEGKGTKITVSLPLVESKVDDVPIKYALFKALNDELKWLTQIDEDGLSLALDKDKINIVAFNGDSDNFDIKELDNLKPNQIASIIITNQDKKAVLEDKLKDKIKEGRVFFTELKEKSDAHKQWVDMIGDKTFYDFKDASIKNILANKELYQELAAAK